VIDRPVDEVWEFVHDIANDRLWQTTLIESEQLTDGPMGVGTRVREVRRFLGLKIELAWERPSSSRSRRRRSRASRARSPSAAATSSSRSTPGRGSR
jgi:hypothetical protein